MTQKMRKNLSFACSIVAVALSVVSFCTTICNCHLSSDGIAVGLMAVCATFIVGYQIYNKIESQEQLKEWSDKIKKIEELQNKNEELQDRLFQSESAILIGQLINDASTIYSDESHYYRESAPEFALLKIFDSIIPAMDADWRGNSYDKIFNAMDAYIDHIGQSGIVEYCRRSYPIDGSVQEMIYRFDLDIRGKIRAIKSHENYQRILEKFEKRLYDIEIKLAEARGSD